MQKRIGFSVFGLVQGVGFRAFVCDRARGLHLVGWVKNELDGRVEGEAEGIEADIAQLTQALRKGPLMSHVDRCLVRDLPVMGVERAFRISR